MVRGEPQGHFVHHLQYALRLGFIRFCLRDLICLTGSAKGYSP